MDASPSRTAYLSLGTKTKKQLCHQFALTIPGLRKDCRGDLGDYLVKLPPELLSMVLRQLIYTTWSSYQEGVSDEDRKNIKKGLSRTSLVCYAWCRIQRPKLFQSIRLRSPADVRILLDMLRHPNNKWLSAAVTDLFIQDRGNRSPISTDRSCCLLLPKLPSLAVFKYSGCMPSQQLGLSSQPVFARHRNIQRLVLSNVLLHSLSVLVHVLGNMANLEVLGVDGWPEHIASSDRPPTRTFLSSFPQLRHVWNTASSNRSGRLGWLLSPLLARQCKDHPEDATSHNSDAALLVLLGDLLCDKFYGAKATVMTYIAETANIVLYNWSPFAITTAKLTLWPSASISSGKWSAIRTIECFTAGDKSGRNHYNAKNENLDEIDWEAIDLSLAQDAIRLEKLIVHSNNVAHQQRLPLRLPELCMLGKFKVEETDSNYGELWKFGHPK